MTKKTEIINTCSGIYIFAVNYLIFNGSTISSYMNVL